MAKGNKRENRKEKIRQEQRGENKQTKIRKEESWKEKQNRTWENKDEIEDQKNNIVKEKWMGRQRREETIR